MNKISPIDITIVTKGKKYSFDKNKKNLDHFDSCATVKRKEEAIQWSRIV